MIAARLLMLLADLSGFPYLNERLLSPTMQTRSQVRADFPVSSRCDSEAMPLGSASSISNRAGYHEVKLLETTKEKKHDLLRWTRCITTISKYLCDR